MKNIFNRISGETPRLRIAIVGYLEGATYGRANETAKRRATITFNRKINFEKNDTACYT